MTSRLRAELSDAWLLLLSAAVGGLAWSLTEDVLPTAAAVSAGVGVGVLFCGVTVAIRLIGGTEEPAVRSPELAHLDDLLVRCRSAVTVLRAESKRDPQYAKPAALAESVVRLAERIGRRLAVIERKVDAVDVAALGGERERLAPLADDDPAAADRLRKVEARLAKPLEYQALRDLHLDTMEFITKTLTRVTAGVGRFPGGDPDALAAALGSARAALHDARDATGDLLSGLADR
ncbi:hypothetical protein [Actinokineospora iranica]|uniref:Uncharacterized protein n=1 Tax=Actinokineospora iranica TaxID=1271860 RepID=A0A1G6RAT6_9PSEU|nr:hypothetical protein [Actinokineospora iranica]SDD01732.1 hypothetical protein SAMN05216174_106251 [Actinokineospora iranica]